MTDETNIRSGATTTARENTVYADISTTDLRRWLTAYEGAVEAAIHLGDAERDKMQAVRLELACRSQAGAWNRSSEAIEQIINLHDSHGMAVHVEPTNDTRRLLAAAKNLRSAKGENVEYDRAIIELIGDYLGMDLHDRAAIITLINGADL